MTAEGDRLFSDAGGGCLYELSAATGAPGWSWSTPGPSSVMGAVASKDIVIVATGTNHGHAPAAVYPVTDRITGLDPKSGHQRWSLGLGEDGQGVPAAIYGRLAVVAKANGSVVGIDTSHGTRRWAAPMVAGCQNNRGLSGVSATVNLLRGPPVPMVAYQCAPAQRIVQLSAATGAASWSWTLPPGRTVDAQTTAGSDSGLLGVLVSGSGVPIATQRPPAGQGQDGYNTDSLLAVSDVTGEPQWEVDGISSTAGVYAGQGRLCTVSAFASTCFESATGTQSWNRAALVPPSHGGSDMFSAMADDRVLHIVEPTVAAGTIPGESTIYRSQPGTFALVGFDIATGRLLNATRLPAFYGGPNQVVVSVDSPPGVVAVTGTHTIVSPQFRETATVEAFSN
ncbi:hypothetical protein GCM10027415_17370 [Humibacter ginsengisoli]